MSAETDLLPLPNELKGRGKSGAIKDYARANLAELQREVEGLRAEVRGLRRQQSSWERHVAAAGCEYVRDEEGDTLVNRRAERLAGALRERRDWFEAQAKSISKGNGSSWDLMQVREQRDLCDAALDQETTNG